MNSSLLFASFKEKSKTIFSYAFGSVLYLWLLIWVYPSISKANGMNDILKSMPENLLKAFGFEGGITSLASYLAGEYYGLLFILIMAVYCVSTANGLIAKLVDRGSMAYLLATPVSRAKIAFSQATVLIGGLILICFFTTIGGLLGVQMFIHEETVQTAAFVKINVVGFLLFFVVCSYCFFFSTLMNDEKRSLAASALLTIGFYGLDLLSKLSDKFEALKYFSLFSVYDPQKIASGSQQIGVLSASLFMSGIIIFTLAIMVFRKRDLPV